MATIKIKRGTSNNLAATPLVAGEPAFTTDTGKLYISNGSSKVLINPVDKPLGLNTTQYYTKLKVNDYGQITNQTVLDSNDIPTLTPSKIAGLGTAALVNTGTSNAQIPTLDATGKFPIGVIPSVGITNYIFASNVSAVTVGVYQPLPLTYSTTSGTALTLGADSYVTISAIGTYFFIYNVSSTSSQMLTTLASGTGGSWIGTASCASTNATPSYINTNGCFIKQVTTVPEKICIKNNSSTSSLAVLADGVTLTAYKIG